MTFLMFKKGSLSASDSLGPNSGYDMKTIVQPSMSQPQGRDAEKNSNSATSSSRKAWVIAAVAILVLLIIAGVILAVVLIAKGNEVYHGASFRSILYGISPRDIWLQSSDLMSFFSIR